MKWLEGWLTWAPIIKRTIKSCWTSFTLRSNSCYSFLSTRGQYRTTVRFDPRMPAHMLHMCMCHASITVTNNIILIYLSAALADVVICWNCPQQQTRYGCKIRFLYITDSVLKFRHVFSHLLYLIEPNTFKPKGMEIMGCQVTET